MTILGTQQALSDVWIFEGVRGLTQVSTRSAARLVVSYVDAVHCVSGMPVVKVECSRRVEAPRFRPCRVNEEIVTQPKIVMPYYGSEVKEPRIAVSLLHETGHAIDMLALGNRTVAFASETHGLWNDWRAAIDQSEHVASLKRQLEFPPTIPGTVPGATDLEYQESLIQNLRINELWARSYAQYIALKNCDSSLLQVMRGPLEFPNPEVPTRWIPRQWDDVDFAPLEAAIDSIFESLGWIVPGEQIGSR